MKKEKKVKLYVNQSQAAATKALLRDNKISFWNDWNHFQFDLSTCVVTLVGVIAIIVVFAAIA